MNINETVAVTMVETVERAVTHFTFLHCREVELSVCRAKLGLRVLQAHHQPRISATVFFLPVLT